ncbi:MICOS complex subunit MIC19 [Copidosoma floridanum]|uniref:MICOS complex subunit MIC19 n=1 Tax=Copidosoma floridanum TaxID=29053 RepID=UPI0006C945B9|nr:MICOS complex subunit MIC19 [Copidosoma floridanum]XP_014216813.1 MICOS complex subunit MIC19 [Copidosoma floridanum]
MGTSQSSRKLTIANDEDDANVIKISDAVAQRLSESAAAAAQSQQPSAKSPVQMSAVAALPARGPLPMHQEAGEGYYPHFTITALEVKQQKEQELHEQQLYWKQRLQNLEKSHQNINRTFDEEYKKALSYFDDCRDINIQFTARPCDENKEKVLKCYQENLRETLKCSDLVQQFSNCVDQRRANLMKCN